MGLGTKTRVITGAREVSQLYLTAYQKVGIPCSKKKKNRYAVQERNRGRT